MNQLLLLASMVIFCSILVEKLSAKLKLPMLLGFVFLGMLFGSEGIFSIPFDNYELTEEFCTIGLIMIMFYGGFGTRWKEAKPVAIKAGLLASVGTIATALLVAIFLRYVFSFPWTASLLAGAVLSSTDAASVFNVLRTSKIDLKHNTASLLEIESGSNDPFAYMMTLICISLTNTQVSAGGIAWTLIMQVGLGVLIGTVVFLLVKWALKHIAFEINGFYASFMLAVAIFSYALCSWLGGNGFLSVYLCGLFVGNCSIPQKKELVHFFDGLTSLMQMGIFFILGLLSTPSAILQYLPLSLAIFLFMTLVARPLSVFALLSGFRCSWQQMTLISLAGLRGAASIVFAIMVVTNDGLYGTFLFSTVFGVVLFSILLQGTFLASCAKRLNMVDPNTNVLRTFSDYTENTDLRLTSSRITDQHGWANQTVSALHLPSDILIAFICRDGKWLVPDGQTVLRKGDELVLAGAAFAGNEESFLREEAVEKKDARIGRTLQELSVEEEMPFVLCIKRKDQFIIPSGSTVLEEGDVFVFRRIENDHSLA